MTPPWLAGALSTISRRAVPPVLGDFLGLVATARLAASCLPASRLETPLAPPRCIVPIRMAASAALKVYSYLTPWVALRRLRLKLRTAGAGGQIEGASVDRRLALVTLPMVSKANASIPLSASGSLIARRWAASDPVGAPRMRSLRGGTSRVDPDRLAMTASWL